MNGNPVPTDAMVGIDVAKQKVDIFAVVNGKGKAKVFANDAAGHRELQHWLVERGFAPAHMSRLTHFKSPSQLKCRKARSACS